MERMKDGAILSNTGHFNVEIEIPALRALAVETRMAREFVEEFTMADGRRIYLIADGRLVNLAAAEGHPALVMDMSFANQALSAEWVIANSASLERKVYVVPTEIDEEIARLKLETMGIDDRHAHGGPGALPRLVGRGDVESRRRNSLLQSRQASLEPHEIVRLEAGAVVVLDQRRLPDERVELRLESSAEVADAIRTLAVRGAPAIGVAAAYGLALAAERGEDLDDARATLAASRPTAVNLVHALDALAADPTAEAARALPRGRGRALPAHGRARRGAVRPRNARADALQRGRARDRRRRLGGGRARRGVGARAARARARRRDAAAAAGRRA